MWYLVGTAGVLMFFAVLPSAMKAAKEKAWRPVRLLSLGDSLTANRAYCEQLEQILVAMDGKVVCRGYAGQGAGVVAAHLGEAWKINATDIVILAGVNDLASGRPVEDISEILNDLYYDAQEAGLRVIAVTLTPWMGHARGPKNAKRTKKLNDWIKSHPVPAAIVDTSVMGDSNGYLLAPYDRGDGLHMTKTGAQDLAILIAMEARL